MYAKMRHQGRIWGKRSPRGGLRHPGAWVFICPGKLTVADSFRIGCIGDLGEKEMRAALTAIRETIDEMGITHCGPKQSEAATA